LGLAIAKSLAEVHGGTLSASSAGLLHGATLTLTLPARKRPPSAPPSAYTKPLHAIDVLLVDDDVRVREALAILLQRAGANVYSAGSAELARGLLVTQKPDVIVCDIAMPAEDGYAFIRHLRTTGCDVRAIALTALSTHDDVQRSLASGFDRHLGKPINIERLIASISELHGSSASLSHIT
jgi:CheY-like chemotaxis protein